MLDLTIYEGVINELDSDDLTLEGKINLACWLGERAKFLVAEIKRLRAEPADKADTQSCGHPKSEIVSSEEGTNYCGACERAATCG